MSQTTLVDPVLTETPNVPGTLGGSGTQSRIVEIAGSIHRLAELEFKILLARMTNVILRIVLAVGFCLIALVFGFIAVIFLYAALFRCLTDYLHVPTAWALLIFAGVHMLLAGLLAVAAIWILNGSGKSGKKAGAVK